MSELVILVDSEVTDAGLEHLKGMEKLSLLHLHGSKATDEGKRKLKKALSALRSID